MKKIAFAILACLLPTLAAAQTGSVKTKPQLDTEIGTTGCTQPTCLYPDNTSGLITPFDIRQGLLDLNATMFGNFYVPPTLTPGQILGNPGFSAAGPVPMAGRVKLTANTTFYVNPSASTATCGQTGTLTCNPGSDSNTAIQATQVSGGTVVAPFATFQAAVNAVLSQVDWNGFRPTINLAHGGHTGGVFCSFPIGTNGSLWVTGDDTNNGAVVITAPNGNYGLYTTHYCIIRLRSVTIADAGSALYGLLANNFGGIDIQNITFAAFNSNAPDVEVEQTGHLELQAPIPPATDDVIVAGNALAFLRVIQNGVANFGDSSGNVPTDRYSVHINAGVTFSLATVVVNGGGANLFYLNSGTFTGSVPNNTKAILNGTGMMTTDGPTSCNSVFPGTVNCTISDGFQTDANDGVNFTNNAFGIGDTAPVAQLSVSRNTSPGRCVAQTGICIANADGINSSLTMQTSTNLPALSANTNPGGAENYQTMAGTIASPGALGRGSIIGQFGYQAYNGSAFPNPRGRIVGVTLENQSPTNEGTGFDFETTAAGTTTRNAAMTIMCGVYIGQKSVISVSPPADPGCSNLQVDGTIVGTGTITSSSNVAAAGTVTAGTPIGIASGGTGAGTIPGVWASFNFGVLTTTPIPFNSGITGDNPINVALPTGFQQIRPNGILFSQCTQSLAGMVFGLFTAPGAGGAVMAAGTSTSSVTNNTANTNNNFQFFNTFTNANTEAYTSTAGQIFLRVNTAATTAGTCTIAFQYYPIP